MNEQVQVQFGGSTGGLDAASNKAKKDIQSVGETANGMKGVFSSLAKNMKDMFSGTNFADASTKMRTVRSEVKGLADGAAHGSIQLGVLGRVLAETAAECAPLAALLAGVAVALTGLYAVKKVLAFGEAMGEVAENIDKVSQRLGMSAVQVQEWNGVAEQIHMSSSQMTMGFTRLERSMYMAANGGKAQGAAFKELKINLDDLKNPSDAVLQIADRFKDMPDGPKKTALAMQLMGRAGAQMIPILNEGSDGLKEMMQVAEDTGSVMSDDLVGAGLAVDEQFDQMHLLGTGLKNMFFEALAPAIHAIVSGMVVLGKAMIASYKSGGTVYQIVQVLAGAFKVLATVVVAVGGVFIAFANVAVAAITSIYMPIKTAAIAMADLMSGNFKAAYNDIKTGARDTANIVSSSLKSAWGAVSGSATTIGGIWSSKLPKGDVKHAADEDSDMDLSGSGAGGKKKKGKKGKDEAAAAKKAAEEKLRAYLEELQAEEEAAEDDYAKKLAIEELKLAAIKKVYGEDSKEYQKALREKAKFERAHAREIDQIRKEGIEQAQRISEIGLNADKDIAQIGVQTERDRINDEVQLGKMGAVEKERQLAALIAKEDQLEADHEDKMFQSRLQAFQDELALLNLPPQEIRRINQQIEQLQADHNAKMKTLAAKQASDVKKSQQQIFQASVSNYKSMLEPISSGFTNMLQGMYNRTMTWKQGLLSIADGLINGWIQKGVEWVAQWGAQELAKTAATTTGNAIRTASTATAATTGASISAAAGMAQISTSAAVGAAGAAAATAPIPFVGPALAPAAAAAALAMILGFGAMIASAEGGYDIPGGTNPLTQLHEKEMVLPAHIAEPLRASLRSAGPAGRSSLGAGAAAAGSAARTEAALRGSGAAPMNLHYGPQYGRQKDASMEDMLQRDGKRLIRYLKNERRKGTF